MAERKCSDRAMSRTIHRLTTRVVAAAKPRPGKRVMLADGGNQTKSPSDVRAAAP
jgi:hypothetical protein